MNIKKCPFCKSKDIKYDISRDEYFCVECGTVLRMPYPYVGGVKVLNPMGYSHGFKVKREIHAPTFLTKSDRGKLCYHTTTRYRHRIPDSIITRRSKIRRSKVY